MQRELEKLEDLFKSGFIFQEDYDARKAELFAKFELEADLSSSGSVDTISLQSSGSIGRSAEIPVLSSVEYVDRPPLDHIRELTERNKKSRNIKLFVSSTFKDMQQERNLLVKKVFPEIKRVCAKRKVNFVYVDFRWGITSEESSGGKVISLCLNEIDNCRPYMIGLLGERYGWTQNRTIVDKVLQQSFEEAQQLHPWLASYTDRSVTELEMLYGSLFYPELSTNSLFYLRDPEYLHGIDIIERKNYEPDSEYERSKLLDLKARIKYSKLPCREYRKPEQVADQILKDLTAMIERDFPLNEAEGFDEIDREVSAQYDIALDKADLYIGKPYYYSTIESHIESNTSTPLVITGPLGSGKTSLISSWWIEQKKKNLADGIVVDFIGVLHNDVSTVLRYVLGCLKKRFNIVKDIPSSPDELMHSLSEWLALCSGQTRTVVVLDGLDQIEEKGRNLLWLPGLFPNNVRVIFTVSSESTMYDTCARKGWTNSLVLDSLKNQEKRQLIEAFLSRFSKKLSHEQIFHLVDSKQTSNPLFLVAILDQLRVFGEYDQLTLFIVDLLRARDLTSLFKDKIFVQWEKDFTQKFVKDVLCLIYCSNNGLLESELSSITNVAQQATWSSFVDAAKDALVDTSGLLSIAHQSVLQAIKERYFEDASTEQHYHRLLANFFHEKSLTPRKVSEYPSHLMFVNDAARMKQFLLDIEVFKMIYNDFTKYQLLKYWQMTKALSEAPELYLKSLQALQNTKPAEFALLSYKIANFLRDSGNPPKALVVFEMAHSVFKLNFGEKSAEYTNFLYDYAALQAEQASYDAALQNAEKTKVLRTQLYGENHPTTAQSIWLIAFINKKRGNFAASILAYKKAIEIAESFYGPSNPTVGMYMQTLADIYRKQASYDNAEELYVKALDINRHAYGEMHPSVAENLDSLGRVLKKKGEYEKAKPLYLQALDIVEKVYGADHIKVALICTDLADVERKLGKSSTAYELYQRSLALNTKQFGGLHPEVAENLNSLGLIEKHRGEYDLAIEHIKQAIDIIEQVFDPEHNKIASFANNLADVYSIQAKYSAATDLYKRALRLNEKYLGADHPEVSENLNALGMISKKRGRYDEAEAFYSRSLSIIEKVYGAEHPKVALYVHNLGVVYRKLKLWDKSWAAYERALNINKKLFGEEHELVAGNLNGLAIVLAQSRRDLDKGVELHKQALAIFEKNFGKDHEKVALTLNYLAEAYRKQGRYDYEGPEKLYLRALEINRRLFGEEHPEVAENLNGLAQVYKNQFNYTKAEPMFKKAIEISERTLGNYHPHVLNRYKNLADLYERQGRIEEAQKYQAKLAQLKVEQEKMLNQ